MNNKDEEIATLEKLRQLKRCTTCGGDGKSASGEACICGGTGSIFVEIRALRDKCFDLETQVESLKRLKKEFNLTISEAEYVLNKLREMSQTH